VSASLGDLASRASEQRLTRLVLSAEYAAQLPQQAGSLDRFLLPAARGGEGETGAAGAVGAETAWAAGAETARAEAEAEAAGDPPGGGQIVPWDEWEEEEGEAEWEEAWISEPG